MEDPPKQFFRLAPGREVRLRYAYFLTCREVVKDPNTDEILELRCTIDPDSRGGNSPDGRKVKGTIHWVDAGSAIDAEVRLYDHLFLKPNPGEYEEGGNFLDNLNPDSLRTATAKVEPGLREAQPGVPYQFERNAYFCVDAKDSKPDRLVFNRTVTLRDSWAKIASKG